VNGVANPVTWTKGVKDGVAMVDVELSRLSQDGLIFVARNVPGKSSLNIVLQDVPPGDDYFLIFINSTHGVLHGTSPRFTILPSSTSPNSTQPSPISGAATVTVNGGPDPTLPFATTFAATENGVLPRWGGASHAWGLGSVMAGCIAGAAWTLW